MDSYFSVLVISEEYPFPPRNGVTIPVANYIRLLSLCGYKVDLLLTSHQSVDVSSYVYGDLFVCALGRNMVRSMLAEIFRKRLYCSRYLVDDHVVFANITRNDYRLVLASPISQVHFGRLVVDSIGCTHQKPHFIAAISDCYSAEIFVGYGVNRRQGAAERGFALFRLLRFCAVSRIEPELLSSPDTVFVQSKRDKAWLKVLSRGRLSSTVKIVSNGVDESLFDLELRSGVAKRYGFVANLNVPFYLHKFKWFYDNVWLKISEGDQRLIVFTKPLTEGVASSLGVVRNDPTVVFDQRFFTSVSDIYGHFDVSIAPIFKSYGFINKVGESLAAGIPVLGDRTAFNGIKGFKRGVHSVVAEDAQDMINVIEVLSTDVVYINNLRKSARELAAKSLSWSSRQVFFSGVEHENPR